MTLEKLKEYKSLILQKAELKEMISDIESIGGIDTTKPFVMSGNNSDPSADRAIRIAEMEEYDRVCNDIREIKRYLLSITDQEVKSIAYAYIVGCKTFEEIGRELHYDKKTISKKLNNYISSNVH